MKTNLSLKKYSLLEIPHYKIYGRTDKTQFPLPLFWNGSGIELNVSGSELWVDLEVDFSFHEPWVFSEINGAFMSRQMLLPGRYSICLFRNMSTEPVKNVRFLRELQAMSEDKDCHVLIHGFQTDGIFFPVVPKALKLEFIGDSITSGEGTYGALADTDWTSMYMSSSRNYAYMISNKLNADFCLISQGGWGVLTGWDNNPNHNLPSCYEKISGLSYGPVNETLGAMKPHDFSSWEPDAVIVNLGTNDASAFNQPAWCDPVTQKFYKQRKNEDGSFHPEDIEKFKTAVIRFLHMIRKNNPKSHIVWVYGMLGYNLTLPITDAINRYIVETKDINVAFVSLPDTTDETVGAHAHPGEKSHIRAAKVLYDYLNKRFNN